VALIYRVDLENTTGSTLAVIKNPTSFECNISIGGKGNYQLVLSGFDDVVNSFTPDIIIRFWRNDTDAGNGWINVFNGIHKTVSKSLTQSGNKTFTSYGPDSNELLDKAYILYAPNSAQSNKTNFATTAMIEFVRENIGSQALVSNGRRLNGTNPITIGGSSGLGPSWGDESAGKHLLTVLQNIRDFSKQLGTQIDFEVQYLGNYQWLFVCGNLYVDRTNVGLNPNTGRNGSGNVPVVFSPLYNNVETFYESLSRYNEVNAVVSLGSGVGALQQFAAIRNLTSVSQSAIAQRETIVNSNDSSLAQLTNVAQSALYEHVATPKVSFSPLLNAVKLWKDFLPGDFITAMNEDREEFHQQLVGTSLRVSQSAGGSTVEQLNLDFESAVGFL